MEYTEADALMGAYASRSVHAAYKAWNTNRTELQDAWDTLRWNHSENSGDPDEPAATADVHAHRQALDKVAAARESLEEAIARDLNSRRPR
jgi:hypothetical protein